MNDKTLTAKANFLAKEARLDADAFRENTVYNGDGDAIRLIANAERLEQYADTIEALQARVEALEAALRDAVKAERDRIVARLRDDARLTEIEARRILGNLVTLTQADTDDWAKLIAMKHGIADALEGE